MLRTISFSLVALSILSAIGFIFWKQELQYVGPTPVPQNYNTIDQGERVNLKGLGLPTDKPLFVHFYNNDCPCSRFNAREFRNLTIEFDSEIRFISIIQSSDKDAAKQFKNKYDLGIPVQLDSEGKIAAALGVYSTPQAVIIKDSSIYFRGNYNKARFCTTKNTKFAELALKALIKNEPAPFFPELAYVAYGCELPANQDNNQSTLNFFNL